MRKDLGVRNLSAGIDLCGLNTTGLVRYNFGEAELVELAVAHGEATLTAHGALRALTGPHTGRPRRNHRKPELVGQQQANDAGSL